MALMTKTENHREDSGGFTAIDFLSKTNCNNYEHVVLMMMFSSPTNHMKPLETLILEAVALCVAFKYISRLCQTLLTY